MEGELEGHLDVRWGSRAVEQKKNTNIIRECVGKCSSVDKATNIRRSSIRITVMHCIHPRSSQLVDGGREDLLHILRRLIGTLQNLVV